ncbi:MAG: hypothetical protein LW865_17620, partial [Betaproteobacteria bacterium]|nr:hypothetical protein [Betaproteobacteria bacterium]
MSTYTYTPNLYQFPSLLKALAQTSGPSPSLDLRFALDKSLTAYRGPTPSFSRASSGTYFGSDGILRTMGLNLLLYSEDFTNGTYWSGGSTARSGNTAVAPDGSLTADTITFNSGSQIYQNPQISSSIGTVSVYVKKVDHRYFSAQIETSSTAHRAVFDLDTALVTDTTSGTSASISDAGNGWFRCSVTKTVAGTTAIWVTFQQSATATFSTGSGSKQFYMWGAQSEIGSSLNTYSKTTSASNSGPRFDHTYNGTSWISRGLLVEEQRTNLFQQSEDFSNAYWVKTNSSILSNSATSPDGNNTADKIVEDTSNNAHYIQKTLGGASATYSLSIYAKAGGRNWILLGWWDGAANRNAYFNISSGSVGTISGSVSTSIVSVGNGWFRCTVTHTSAISVMYTQCATSDGVSSYTGDGTSGVFIWGAQLEAGAFPTSYIPTTSASATRSADVCQITGSDFSSFWNASEGSFVAEFDNATPSSGPSWYPMIFAASDAATNAKRMFFFGEIPTNNFGWLVSDGTTASKISPTPYIGNTTPVTSAMCYKLNDLGISLNGGAVLTDLSQPMPTGIDRLQIGHNASANTLCGHIARLRYFKKRLPNATLQLLSEPDPTLNLQFALNKTLTPVVGPTPSFSRASTGTYFNASGVLTSASINTPRFDHVYSGGQWVSRGLLVEEQRTNILNYSEDFSNAYWFKFNSPTLTANTSETTSPDGTNSATKVVSGTTSETDIYKTGLYSGSGSITFSIYAKAGTSNFFGIGLNGGGYDFTVNFDLSNGTYNQRNLNGYTGTSISMTGVGNGWYRCSLTANNLSVSTGVYLYCCANSLSTSSTTSGNSNYLFGAQLEVGSFATSYIKSNSGSSVTRSADVCQITGTSFNWMWNQGEGSVVAEFDRSMAGSVTSDSMIYIAAGTGAPSNIQNGAYITSANITTYGYDSAFTYNFNHGSQLANTVYKVATAIKLNDFASSLNGLAVLTDNSGTVGTNERLLIGHLDWSGGNRLNGHIAKLIYYPARLTNTKL